MMCVSPRIWYSWQKLYVPAMLCLCAAHAFGGTDTFEDIGVDGTPIYSRIIDGVTITLDGNVGPLEARTYFDDTPMAFDGAPGGGVNDPLHPENVSGSRFLRTYESFNDASPLSFAFSEAIQGFGLTTIDIIEYNDKADISVSLLGYDAHDVVIAQQTRTGPQGPSGFDMDWYVYAPAGIWRAELRMSGPPSNWDGYGIDDIVVSVPEPSIILMCACGAVCVTFRSRRRFCECGM